MKIALVCPRFYPEIGGVETHVYEISKRISKHFDLEVIATDPSGKLPKEEEINGIFVRRFHSFAPSASYFFSLSLYNYLKKYKSEYDLIHAHNYHALPALFAAVVKDKDFKFVFTPHYHGRGHTFIRDILHKPYKIVGKSIFKKADAIICVSKFEQKLILNNFNICVKKIYVIPNGINLVESERTTLPRCRKDNFKKLLYVGRIEKYKGIDYIVKSMKYLPENYILEIIGCGSYKPSIVHLAKKMKVSNRVKFYQNLNKQELIEKYITSDVLILLSRYEAYGLVVAEALAYGTPCIVANTSALQEWVDNKSVFGISYPPNPRELSKLIIYASNIKKIKKKYQVGILSLKK